MTSAVAALSLAFPTTALALTGGAVTPGSAPPPPSSEAGAPAAAPTAGAISLISAEAAPRKSFYYGYRAARIKFTIGSTQADNDLRIDVVDSGGAVIKTFYRGAVEPNVPLTIRWDGSTNENRPAPNGSYSFRVSPQAAGAPAARRTTSSTSSRSASPSTASPSRSSARTNSGWGRDASAPAATATPIRARTRWQPAGRRWSPPAAASSSTPATRRWPATTS